MDAERRLTLCAVLGGGGVALAWTASINKGPDQGAAGSEGAASIIAVKRLCALVRCEEQTKRNPRGTTLSAGTQTYT
jgi:hypothetical protein